MPPPLRPAVLAGLIFALLAASLLADDATPDVKPKLDPQAQQVMRKTADYYKSLNSLSTRATVHLTYIIGSQKMPHVSLFAIAAKRPDGFAMRMESGDRGGTFITNTQRQWAYVPGGKVYSSQPAATSFDKALDNDMIGRLSAGTGTFVATLLRDDPYTAAMAHVTELRYVGKEKLGDINTHHLRFIQPQTALDMWIEDGDRPLLRKVVPDFSDANQTAGPKTAMTVTYDDWQLNADLPADTFTFQPPALATRLVDLMANPLLGQKAPAFTLTGLDGKTYRLADHRGKDIVILDFWASWCGWCSKAAPVLDQLANQYKNKNVVLYAVNVHEPANVARNSVMKRKLPTDNVLLDADGEVADTYGVEALPVMVIIAKDGTIQTYHTGVPRGSTKLLAERFQADLHTLISGKKIAEFK